MGGPENTQLFEVLLAPLGAVVQRGIVELGEALQNEVHDTVFDIGELGEGALTVDSGNGFGGPQLGASLLEDVESVAQSERG